MAHLHRLIFAALVLFSSWLPSTSYASFPASPNYRVVGCGAVTGFFSTYEAAGNACRADRTAYLTSLYGTTTATVLVNVPYIILQYSPASMGNAQYLVTNDHWSCPSSSALSGSTCSCDAGYSQSGSSCVVPQVNNCPPAGTSAGRWERPHVPGRGISDPYLICDGATPSGASDGSLCVVQVVGDIGVGSPPVVYGHATYTGGKSASCNGDGGSGSSPSSGNANPPVPGQPAPTPCKSGYAPGTVNGITSCYPAGATGKPVTTTSTGSSTTSVDGNTPTSSGSSTSVTCQLGNCTSTTSTTTTNSAGASSTTITTKTESEGDFCKANPRAAQCVTSAWGGSCSANFTCDGDAIMCAVSREQHIRNCKLFDDMSSTEAQLYTSEKGKSGAQTSTLPGSTSIQISSASFDTSDAIGAGSGCIADKSVTVAGSVVTLPFSSVCGHLAMLGNILVAVSFLLAGRIVVRG